MQLILSKSTIRLLRSSDAEAVTQHVGTWSVARNLAAVPHPYALSMAEEWLATEIARTPPMHFAIALDDELVGVIGLGSESGIYSHSAEIGYWLGESLWGRGIMSEALAALTEWAFSERSLVRLHAGVFARNPASARVLEKAGYQLEGRSRARYFREGEYIDSLLYAKVRLPDSRRDFAAGSLKIR
jgi:ribosomal-protein-alanine N-acetyltransferase